MGKFSYKVKKKFKDFFRSYLHYNVLSYLNMTACIQLTPRQS